MKPTPKEASIMAQRRSKVQRLRENGIDPFPLEFPDRIDIALLPNKEREDGAVHRVAGRLIGRRRHTQVVFMDLSDSSGKIEVLCLPNELGDTGYGRIGDIDIGDLLGVEGRLVSGRGGTMLQATSLTLLGKALMIPPQQGARQIHQRSVPQELDMIAGGASIEMLRTRHELVHFLREWFDAAGFLEVETPLLLPHASGAAAQPFATQSDALAGSLFLRISVEQSLKRLVIGGLENVYELGRCFRNEGLSKRHHFEFTMLEWLQGYQDYRHTMDLIEAAVSATATEVFDRLQFQRNGKTVDLTRPWRRITMCDAIAETTGIDVVSAERAELLRLAGLDHGQEADWAHLVSTINSKRVEPNILEPTFVTDTPRELWPLARRRHDAPNLAESFEAVIAGIEIASGATNSNDVDALRWQLTEQRDRSKASQEHDGALAGLDESFLEALAHGMMPMTGAGMGVERVLMLLMEHSSLRDVIPTPTLRA